MLWACLHFADFSLQLLLRGAKLSSPTIITTGGNRPEVLSSNPTARNHGIAPGMTVSAAIALAPDLIDRPRDPAGEMRALEGIAAWAGQFTSIVGLAPPDVLLLEIEGSLRLCGGLRPLLLRLSQDLAELGYTAAIAVAPTPAAARLLARAGVGSTITDNAALETALAGLPLCLLDQPEDTIRMLALMGVHTSASAWHCRATGWHAASVNPCWTSWTVHWADCPTRVRPGLHPPLPSPACPACAGAGHRAAAVRRQPADPGVDGLAAHAAGGITRLKLVLLHEERRPTLVCWLRAQPRSAPHPRIVARAAVPSPCPTAWRPSLWTAWRSGRWVRALSLFPEDRLPEEERWLIIEHLRARLGSDAVYSIASHSDHRPELACAARARAAAAGDEHAKRPLWLLDPPQRLRKLAICRR
jgi:protein ImuB